MKHLFLVHSFATYRCSLGVIEHEGLDRAECIILSVNGFFCPDLPVGISTGEIDSMMRPNINSVRRVFEQRRVLGRRDREINELTQGQKFHCYTPHTYYDFVHLIVTHPKCLDFSYIEEGLTSYYQPGEIDEAYVPWSFVGRVKSLRSLFFGRRLDRRIGFFCDRYRSVYGFCDESFPGWRNKVVIGMGELFPCNKADKPDHAPILVFDALVELGMTSSALLCAALDKFFQICKDDGTTDIHYKFHPGQTEKESIDPIRETMARHPYLKLHELSKGVCLENLFSDHQMKVFVFNSASGLYAALIDQEVVSLNSLLESVDVDYGQAVSRLPAIYHGLVKAHVMRGETCLGSAESA